MIPSKLNENITREVYQALRKANTERELSHQRSGKLSAGRLGKPLLEQILYVIGVPKKSIEDYALGLFRRGEDVEDAIINLLSPDATQVEVEYKNVVGFIDAVRNGMPYEVKSIKNSQVKYVDPTNQKRSRQFVEGKNELVPEYSGPKYAHVLQATLYGLAQKSDYVTVLYVAADDLRTIPHVIETKTMSDEVERIIKEFNDQLKTGTLPKWEAREDWQEKFPQYSDYPDWISLDPETAMQKLKQEYPEAYKTLKGGK
jgi:hypothetical protein